MRNTGARLPTSAKMPKAKAISDAAGIAHSLMVNGFLNWPSSISRLISKLNRKTKIAINPSLILKTSGFYSH